MAWRESRDGREEVQGSFAERIDVSVSVLRPRESAEKKIPDVGDVTTIANKYIVHILHDETDLFVFQKCRGGHHRQKALYCGLRR